jgi:hypothetical protein
MRALVDDPAEPVPARTPRRRRRRRWLVVAAVFAALLLGVGSCAVVRWQSRGPDEASVSDALGRFRASSTTVVAESVQGRPAAGVYTYAGTGEEELSFAGTHQAEGPSIPGTVTYGDDDCWTFQIDYNTFHRQTWDWCARDGRMVELGGTTQQKFDFVAFKVDEHSTFSCDPPFVVVDPRAEPGDTVAVSCRGHSETTDSDMLSSGTNRFAGRETIDVGGRPVDAVHYIAERTMSGDQTGTEHSEMWFAADTGLPLRNERTITVVSPAPSPLDSVTYTEHGSWALQSLTPQT